MTIFSPFTARYKVEGALELPASGKGVSYFPPREAKGRLYELSLAFMQPKIEPWYGVFAARSRNEGGLTFACTMPNASFCCVSCMGTGYVVNIIQPSEWSEIRLYPIMQLLPVIGLDLLILSSFTKLEAYNATGRAWSTEHLCSDGLNMQGVEDRRLNCKGWDVSEDREISLHVDILTGKRV